MEKQELPGPQTEEAFHKSGPPGEALLPEVQGYEDSTGLRGERDASQDGSPGWHPGGGATVPGLLFLEPLKGNTFKINRGGKACTWITGIP